MDEGCAERKRLHCWPCLPFLPAEEIGSGGSAKSRYIERIAQGRRVADKVPVVHRLLWQLVQTTH